MFGDLFKIDSGTREYEDLQDIPKMIKILEEKLDFFNTEFSTKTKLVFFDDALEHILRISRILR